LSIFTEKTMAIFRLQLNTICIVLAMIIWWTVCFEESQNDSNIQISVDNDFKIFRARLNRFLRAIISNDNDISQEDDFINEEQTFIWCDHTNSTYCKNRKGRICVLCKWGITPCCAPNIWKKNIAYVSINVLKLKVDRSQIYWTNNNKLYNNTFILSVKLLFKEILFLFVSHNIPFSHDFYIWVFFPTDPLRKCLFYKYFTMKVKINILISLNLKCLSWLSL
jgi:hypothetical protein